MDEIVFLLVGGGSLHDDGQTLVLSLILLRPSMVVPTTHYARGSSVTFDLLQSGNVRRVLFSFFLVRRKVWCPAARSSYLIARHGSA